MAAQDVEFEAIMDVDGRFGRLAELLGLADADHARGKVEHLWMACTTRGETDLPQWLVERHLGERGPEALVEAELARWGRGRGDSKTRRMYICGSKKRCLWMRNNQEQAPKGGESRARDAERSSGRFDKGSINAPSIGSEPTSVAETLGDQTPKSSNRKPENTSPLPSPSSLPLLPFPSPFQEEEIDRTAAPPPATVPLHLTPDPSQPRAKRDPRAHKRLLPKDWTPRPQERDRAARAGIDVDAEAERFRDHHTARANTMADWDAAFRTWLSNALRFANGTRAGPRPNAPNRNPVLANMLDDIARREAAGET